MIEELRRFLMVAETRNLTRAAEKLFITQAAMTQSLQRLERELGVESLFVQRGRNMELSVDGQVILLIAEKIVDLWEKARNRDLRISLRRFFSVGMFDNAASKLALFLKSNSESKNKSIELVIDSSHTLLRKLQLGVLDIAILVKRLKAYPEDVVELFEFEEELIPVAKKDFGGVLEEMPFVLFNSGSATREQIDQVFRDEGLVPRIFAESTSPTFMKELALLNCGVALLPRNLVERELQKKDLVVQSLPIRFKRKFGLYAQNNRTAGDVLELAREMAASLAY